MNKINVIWSGPYPIDIVKQKTSIGLYQIYGTHPIYGRNVLLYIGKTERSYAERFISHETDWIRYEYDDVSVYLGEVKADGDIKKSILDAEKLLIYYCAPAYNSNELTDYRKNGTEDIILMNFGRIASLPTEVSSLWYDSDIWTDEKNFGRKNNV